MSATAKRKQKTKKTNNQKISKQAKQKGGGGKKGRNQKTKVPQTFGIHLFFPSAKGDSRWSV